MSLDQYRRNGIPSGLPSRSTRGRSRQKAQPIFVVQRHDARRLHYDFRLERNGALASWAVPKGVPLEPGEQHLAVHVEDHPIEYASSRARSPRASTARGTVEIWDNGTYELVEEKPNGGLTVRLHGERLDGVWALIPAHLDGKEQNWLIVRKREDTEPSEDVAPAGVPADARDAREDVPAGDGWLFEVKWDGYRAVAYVQGGRRQAPVAGRDNDLTPRFPHVAKEIAKAVKSPDAVLDGEVCALDDEGRASFSAMQQGGAPLVYYAFDLLELDGESQLDLPLAERQQRLAKLLDRRNRTVRLSETFDDGDASTRQRTHRSSKGSWPSARTRVTSRGGARATG